MKYILVLLGFLFASCEPRSGQGIVAGGVAGAAFGESFVGTRSTPGAVVIVLDEQDRQLMLQNSPRTVDRMAKGEPLTINDIIKLHENGVSDDTIIGYVRDTKTIYDLSQAQILRMQNSGVSQRVINYLIETTR